MSSGHSRVTTAVVVIVAALLSASPAAADHVKLVTLAARYCPSYTSIRANEARNNIMESLHDLGANTPYGSADAMDPDVEAATQPECQPLAGWRFTFGTGIQTRSVPGPWGALSKVTSPYSTPIVTLPSTPLLNNVNAPTGRTIAGAVTIELSDSQREQAAKANLWVMGGTPTAPIAEPDVYAFGALRCGVDNLNGDNVEYVSYPAGATHVFCFAYYVRPAPTSGTIIVRKQLQGAPAGTPPQTVRFTGNISYTNDQSFTLTASRDTPGSATFYRGAGSTWSFAEDAPPPGQEFAGVSCSSSTGASTPTTNQANRAASVLLGAGDVVTCTFTDRSLPPSGLLLRKVTLGKVGTFGFSVSGGSLPSARHVEVTTAEEGIAAGAPELPLATGDYTVDEQPPASPRGTWALESVFCGANEITPVDPARVHVPASGNLICTFTNRFTPAGAIRVHKVTLGDVTTTSFVVSPTFGTPARFLQTARTTATGRPALADGDDTSALPVGEYVIQETAPFVANPPGSWRVDAVECDGLPVPSDEGRITVRLTAANPEIDCTFTDEFTRPPELPVPPPSTESPPPAPDPLPGPPVSAAGATVASDPTPLADLVVTKTATPTRLVLGGKARYLVTVRNRGPATARSVTVAEQNARGDRFLALNASKGHCHGAPPRFCVIGTLRPGARATVTVSVDPLVVGTLRNIVAANTATLDPTIRGNAAVAAIHVLPAARPQFTG